jgi:glycosyltransferase involved in cell wall biosynthesis
VRVALVHDWMVRPGGGERVLWAMHLAFPDAPIYTSFYNADALPEFRECDVRTSFLQRWPFSRLNHQFFPSLRAVAFESFDFSGYDLVISTSSAEAKGILTPPETLHVSYVFTPTRYYWSDYHGYRANPGFGRLNGVIRAVMPMAISRRRLWDFAAAQRPDRLVADCRNVANRIEKYYRRQADAVIYPPIDLSNFSPSSDPPEGFIVVSRFTPYKRIDLAIEACERLGVPLTVVGSGPEEERLRRLAGPHTTFAGTLDDAELARRVARSRALIFPADEDFGMVPLEAMACGRPVVAFGKGGALETVIDGTTGVLFPEQTVDSVVEAILRLDGLEFDPAVLRAHAEQFETARFIEAVRAFVDAEMQASSGQRGAGISAPPTPEPRVPRVRERELGT